MLGMDTTKSIRAEMEHVQLGDVRLEERAKLLLERVAAQPQGTLAAAMQSRAETVAAYRFLHNDSLGADALLQAHRAASVERMQGHARVLCLADSSFIGYGHRAPVKGLGPHNRGSDNGFFIHPTFAVSSEGLALGTVHWHSWVRDAALDKHKTQASRPVDQKESARWLQSHAAVVALQAELAHTRLTFIADREGDFYELLEQAHNAPVDFIIRAQAGRLLEPGWRISEPPANTPALGTVSFPMSARAGHAPRQVTQKVWVQRCALSARRGSTRTAPVELTVLWASEVNCPAGQEPVHWILLTNLPVLTLEQAREIIDCYRLRWRIEMLFDALKNTCHIEDSQLREAAALQNLCALNLIVAWRILFLMTLSRTCPHEPAQCVFASDELEVLTRAVSLYNKRTFKLDTLQQAVTALAMLGGYLARKNDKPPGIKILARGYERLRLLTDFQRLSASQGTCV